MLKPIAQNQGKIILLSFILVVLILLIYFHTLNYPFVFDDFSAIVKNKHLLEIFQFPQDVKSFYVPTRQQNTRFFSYLTFALNKKCFGLRPLSYRVVNIIIHCINTLVVFYLGSLLLRLSHLSLKKEGKEGLPIIAFASALIFAVHPVQTQAVTFITQRFASLATFFYLTSLCCYLKMRMVKIQRQKLLFLIASIFLCLMGMLSKEIVLSLPIMIVMVELILLNEIEHSPKKNSLRNVILFVPLLFVIPLMMKRNILDIFQYRGISHSHPGDIYSFPTYVLTQLRVFTTFVRLLVFPINQRLDYDFVMSHSLWEPLSTFASAVILLILFVIALKVRRGNHLLSFGIFWFFIAASVNLVPRVNVIFEHKLYLISVGCCLGFSSWFYSWVKNGKKYLIMVVLIGLTFSLLTYQRNCIWKDKMTLWQDEAKKSPNKSRVINNLADAYRESEAEDLALEYYNRAIKLDPENIKAYNNRALIWAQRQNYDLALEDYNKILKMVPKDSQVYLNRGNLYRIMGQTDKAFIDYNKALYYKSDNENAFYNKATLLQSIGHIEEAIEAFTQAIESNPEFIDPWIGRAEARFLLKQLDESQQDLSMALRLDPLRADLYNNRAKIYFEQHRYAEAIIDYNAALKANYKNFRPLLNIAVCYIQQNNYSLALESLNRYLSVEKMDVKAYLYRGFVLSQLNQPEKALKDYHRVLKIEPGHPQALKQKEYLLRQ